MEFGLSEIQTQLQDTTAKLLADFYDFEVRRRIVTSQSGMSREFWGELAELGLLGVAIDEDYGGSGLGFRDLCVVTEQFGRHLVVEPFVATVVVGASLVQELATGQTKSKILSEIVAGKTLLALAHGEPQSRHLTSLCETVAERIPEGYRLTGKKAVVLGGASADYILVSAQVTGSPGISLFLVDANAVGLARRAFPLNGGGCAAELVLSDVLLGEEALLGALGEALPAIERAIDLGTVATCTEAVGVMQTVFEQTRDYVKIRKAFGTILGSFQVVQHKLVDMLAGLEHSRSIALLAADQVATVDTQTRKRLVSAAKVQIDKAGRYVGQTAVQLHGGIGITMECAAANYFARLTAISQSYGDRNYHLTRFATTT